MHIYKATEAPRFEPAGHYGHLEVSDIVGTEQAGFKTQLSYCPPGGGGDMHHHDAEDQLFVVIKGELTFDTGQERFTLSEQQAVLFHAGDPHFTVNESDADSVSLVVTVAAR
ncbi:MAG: cupin domain-containing protein [Propionibacteriaceae bacterium]